MKEKVESQRSSGTYIQIFTFEELKPVKIWELLVKKHQQVDQITADEFSVNLLKH